MMSEHQKSQLKIQVLTEAESSATKICHKICRRMLLVCEDNGTETVEHEGRNKPTRREASIKWDRVGGGDCVCNLVICYLGPLFGVIGSCGGNSLVSSKTCCTLWLKSGKKFSDETSIKLENVPVCFVTSLTGSTAVFRKDLSVCDGLQWMWQWICGPCDVGGRSPLCVSLLMILWHPTANSWPLTFTLKPGSQKWLTVKPIDSFIWFSFILGLLKTSKCTENDIFNYDILVLFKCKNTYFRAKTMSLKMHNLFLRALKKKKKNDWKSETKPEHLITRKTFTLTTMTWDFLYHNV